MQKQNLCKFWLSGIFSADNRQLIWLSATAEGSRRMILANGSQNLIVVWVYVLGFAYLWNICVIHCIFTQDCVTNLDLLQTNETELKQFFTVYGAVKDCKIIVDRGGISKRSECMHIFYIYILRWFDVIFSKYEHKSWKNSLWVQELLLFFNNINVKKL